MGILVVGGILVGMVLGQFFKYAVLIPACGIAVILVLTSPVHLENSLLDWFLKAAVVTASLQLGYVVGLFGRSFHSKLKRSKKPRGRDGISSSLADAPDGGRKAA